MAGTQPYGYNMCWEEVAWVGDDVIFGRPSTLICTTLAFFHCVENLKVHKIEIFFGFDFEICMISLLVMSKY